MKYFLLLLVSCAGFKPKPIPVWNGKLFIGDSSTSSIKRNQDNEVIACNSKMIDNYVCMSAEDFRAFYTTYVLGCHSWGKAKLSVQPYYNNVDAIGMCYDNSLLRVQKTTDR